MPSNSRIIELESANQPSSPQIDWHTAAERRAAARQLHETGMSGRAIARAMGASEATIRRDLAGDAPSGRPVDPNYPDPLIERIGVQGDHGMPFGFTMVRRLIFNPWEKYWTAEITLEMSGGDAATQADALAQLHRRLQPMFSATLQHISREGTAD
jgi:hypothetical protein